MASMTVVVRGSSKLSIAKPLVAPTFQKWLHYHLGGSNTHHPTKDPPQEVLVGEVFERSLEGVVGNGLQEDLVALVLVLQVICERCDRVLRSAKVVPSLLPENSGGVVVSWVLDVLAVVSLRLLIEG